MDLPQRMRCLETSPATPRIHPKSNRKLSWSYRWSHHHCSPTSAGIACCCIHRCCCCYSKRAHLSRKWMNCEHAISILV